MLCGEPTTHSRLEGQMSSNSRNYFVVILLMLAAILYLQTRSLGRIVPLRSPLKAFPLEIKTWKGAEVPIEDRVLNILGVEDYLNRAYREVDKGLVYLYIGYYQTQKQGDTIHSPKNCLPGSGWEHFDVGYENISLQGHPTIRVNSYLIEKGTAKQVVYYWYQSNGRVIASEYWGKIHLVMNAMTRNRTDGALVRVTAPISSSTESAKLFALKFIQDSFPLLDQFIPK